MRRAIVALVAASTVLSACPALAEPVVLKPSSPWNVDFGDERCRLIRLFSDGTNEHLLYFEQHFPSGVTGVTAAGRSFKSFENRAKTEVHTAVGRAPLETKPYMGDMERFENALIYPGLNLSLSETDDSLPSSRVGLPSLDTAFADSIDFISFRQRSREVRFDTGRLCEAFKVLNQCATGLIEGWGREGAQHLTALRLPRWINETEIVRKITANYPLAASNRGEQGITRMRVIVDEQGAVEDCVVIKATTTEKLESPACRAMKEARFEPGLDSAGKPMRSYYATTVTYQIN